MKHLFLIIVLPFMVSSQIGSEQSLENKWHYDIQAAKMIANQQHKNILVYFTGSDWCPSCKVLKKDFF